MVISKEWVEDVTLNRSLDEGTLTLTAPLREDMAKKEESNQKHESIWCIKLKNHKE